MAEEDVDLPGVEYKGHEFQPSAPKNEGEGGFITKQGLKKKLIKSGVGWETPEAGDEVTVHYTGTLLDGTKFDSSRDRGEPFTFKLGQGQVIKGWDEGIITMKKGENALFTVAPSLAYGAEGAPPTIPVNATLQFDIELISWTKVVDVCEDGGILKKILFAGQSYEKPKDPDEVTVKYGVKLEDGTIVAKSPEVGVEFYVKEGHFCPAIAHAVKTMKKGETVILTVKPQFRYTACLHDGTIFEQKGFESEGPFEFVVGEEQVLEALDQAVATMKKGEVAFIIINPEYGFGKVETQRDLTLVPANSTLTYEVEMLSFTKEKESWDMGSAEKIEAAGQKKEEGNTLFKIGKYQRAAKKYEKATRYIEFDSSFSDEQKKQAKVLKVLCNLNNAACKLKLKEFKEAIKLCSMVLDLESQNVKALYRRAQAYIKTADLDLAEFDIKKALEINPKNRDVKLEYKTLKQRQIEYNKKDATFYGNMFARLGKLEASEAKKAEVEPMDVEKSTGNGIAEASYGFEPMAMDPN